MPNSTEDDYQESLEYIFEVILLSIVGVLGIIGNVMVFVLFSKQRHLVSKAYR